MKGYTCMIALLGIVLIAEGCDTNGLQDCVKQFTDKYPDAASGMSSKYDAAALDKLCVDFDIAAVCAKPTLYGCSQHIKAVWWSIDNVLKYICIDESKHIVAMNEECLKSTLLEKRIKLCNNSFIETAHGIRRDGGTHADLCNALKTVTSCITDSGTTACNEQVGDWYGGLINAALEPSKDLIDCHFTGVGKHSDHHGRASDGAPVFRYSFILLLLAALMALYICFAGSVISV